MILSDRTTIALQCFNALMISGRTTARDAVADSFAYADEFLKYERDHRITKRRVETLEHALTQCRDRFQEYADLHAAKPDPDKAARNRAMVGMIGAAMRSEP